jgi:hypothetical protein
MDKRNRTPTRWPPSAQPERYTDPAIPAQSNNNNNKSLKACEGSMTLLKSIGLGFVSRLYL